MSYPPKYWNAAAHFWDQTIVDSNNPHQFYYSEAYLYIHDLIRVAKRVLELACGTGGATLKAARPGLDLVALDCAHKMVAIAATKLN
jgi:2-polyprenyl-3-methyl-5-hydroxy-6-metoxy-1,4-benzoquinol methylase